LLRRCPQWDSTHDHVFMPWRTEKNSLGFMASKENKWVASYDSWSKEETAIDTVKARKPAYYSHIMRKQGSYLKKQIMQGTMTGACRRGRPRTAWMDSIKTWTGLPVKESVRMTEDRDKWRKYVHGVANPGTEDGYRSEQNSVLNRKVSNDWTK